MSESARIAFSYRASQKSVSMGIRLVRSDDLRSPNVASPPLISAKPSVVQHTSSGLSDMVTYTLFISCALISPVP
jgi:hypothetical protein